MEQVLLEGVKTHVWCFVDVVRLRDKTPKRLVSKSFKSSWMVSIHHDQTVATNLAD